MGFIEMVNNLKSLGKTNANERMVRKVIWCIIRSKWGPNVVVIKQAQDLKTLKLDDHVGKL